MVWLTILNNTANAVPGSFVRCRTLYTCTLAVAAPRRASADRHAETSGIMTAAPKPSSPQDGFFSTTKALEEMSNVEWERLCDGCPRSCLESLAAQQTVKI